MNTQSVSEKGMLKPDDIAEYLVISKRTVLRWIEHGSLPAYRIGGVTRIGRDDFNRFLKQHKSTKVETQRVRRSEKHGWR